MTKAETVALIGLELKARDKAVELAGEIIKIAPKFNGKEPNKRLDTALKAIDEGLKFSLSFNSFKIELYIGDRNIISESGKITQYIDASSVSIVHASITSAYNEGICQTGTINAALLITELENFRRDTKKNTDRTRSELEKIDTILAEYEEVKNAVAAFIGRTSYLTRDYFKMKE